jgi:hypothetical protein
MITFVALYLQDGDRHRRAAARAQRRGLRDGRRRRTADREGADTPVDRSGVRPGRDRRSGNVAQVLAHAPSAAREQLAAASTSPFVHALNDILLIAAVVALAGGVVALALMRPKDFVDSSEEDGAAEAVEAEPAAPELEPAA